jgi:transposase-like protein
LIESLGIFKRNKVPLELKMLGLASYIQLSNPRRVAKALSEVHKVSKAAVGEWARKLSERLNANSSRIPRRFVAFDEVCVKVNGLGYWAYAAVGVRRDEIISIKGLTD